MSEVKSKAPATTKVLILKRAAAKELGEWEIKEMPLPELKAGEFLVQNEYLSVDPRDRLQFMGDDKVGQPQQLSAVGKIIQTTTPNWPIGTYVSGVMCAAQFAIANGTDNMGPFIKVDPKLAPISTSLGVLGMPGATAYFGVKNCLTIPKGGSVLVTCAAGAVGSLVGQLAKRAGAGKVIGTTSSQEKCAYLLTRGYDVALNYKDADFEAKLAAAAAGGVDAFFDNVGGPLMATCLKYVKHGGSMAKCGAISMYNQPKHDYFAVDEKFIQERSINLKVVSSVKHRAEWEAAFADIAGMIKRGELKYDETTVEGLENVPRAYGSLFSGGNIGKQLIKLR